MPVEHTPDRVVGDVVTTDADAPIEEATWYTAESHEDRLVYEIEPGSLADAVYLTCDLLLDGGHLVKWELRLHESGDGPTFGMRYSALNQCQACVRVPLTATNQDRWKYDREGAWLKPLTGGDRMNLEKLT
jgi:hypothetical protein